MKKAARRARLAQRRQEAVAAENPQLAQWMIVTAADEAKRAYQRQQRWFRALNGPEYLYAVVCATLRARLPGGFVSDSEVSPA